MVSFLCDQDSWKWLRNGFLKKETEDLILAAREQALTLFRLGGGGGRLMPPRLKSFITHVRLHLQCSYFVAFPQIYLGTIWCC